MNKSSLTRSLVAVSMAAAALAGASTASANAGAYAFGYTYSPNNFGVQQLILNGGAITLTAMDMGWYDYKGLHVAVNKDYIVGDCSIGTCGGVGAYNNFFEFDLSGVTVPITSAQLSLGNPSTKPGYSGLSSSTYTTYDVSTPLSALSSDNTSAVGIYNDLGSGTSYGFATVSAADNGTQVMFGLNAAGLASLNAAEGSQWAVGGTLGTFSVPEPASWALMLVGFGLVGFGLRRSKTRAASLG